MKTLLTLTTLMLVIASAVFALPIASADEEVNLQAAIAEERDASQGVDTKLLICGDLGDVFKNGKIGWGDHNAVVDYIRGAKKLTPQQKLRADVTGDKRINWGDAEAIRQYIKNGTPFKGCPPEYHTLTVSMDTPPGANVPTGAGVNALGFTLTPGAFDNVISEVVFTRKGLSANEDIQMLHLVDGDGFIRGAARFNAENEARMRFFPGYELTAQTPTKFFARPFVADGVPSGRTFTIGLKSITTTARVIGLDTPLWGNEFQVVSLAVGSAEVMEDGMTSDSTPDVGDADVVANQCRVVAGSIEPLIIENVSALARGSAPISATSNIELRDTATGASLGQVLWKSQGRADWGIKTAFEIPQGGTWRCQVLVDIFGGYGFTVNADIMDGDTVLMSIRGGTYGYYILPNGNYSHHWTNPNNGLAANSQTIQPPSLEIRVVSDSPSTEIGIGPGCMILASWDFFATGDQVKISSFPIGFDLQTMTEDEIANFRLRDAYGKTLAGPWNLGTTDITGTDATNYEGSVYLTETIVLPRAKNLLSLEACIRDTVSTGDMVRIGIPDSGLIIAEGLTSRMPVTIMPFDREINGNWLTVLLPAAPRFSISPSSPSGTLVPSTQTLLAKVAITAPIGGGDVSFQERDGNSLVTNIAISGNEGEMTFTVKDEDGTTLDVVSVFPSESLAFLTDFSTGSLVIPDGNAKALFIYGNTLEFTEGGIQLWWDDDNPSNICWGVDGIGNHCHAEIVFRGDLFAGTLIHREPSVLDAVTDISQMLGDNQTPTTPATGSEVFQISISVNEDR